MSFVQNDDQQDISTRDSLLVDNLMQSVAADSSTAWRFRTIIKMNPYMANHPDAVAAMANMPIATQDLMSQAGALYGMQVGNALGTQLQQYDPSTQRAIFSQLTPAQQSSLFALGYNAPSQDVHEQGLFGEIMHIAAWPFGKVFGGVGQVVSPVIGPALHALGVAGDYPSKIYRTIKQLDGATQFLSLLAGAGTAAAIALAPVTGGGSLAFTAALQSARIGLALTAGMAAAGATSLVASSVQTGGTSTWINAWSAAYNGERLFSQSGIEKANKLLEDPSLQAIAQDLASESNYPGDLSKIAREFAGVRSSTNPNVQNAQLEKVAAKYAEPNTPQFTQAYNLLSELLTLPAFTSAVEILEKSKISMGRDLVRAIGVDPSSGWGRWISGSIDATTLFMIDPFIVAGAAMRGVAQARRGIQFVETMHSAERIRQIAMLPEMERKFSVVANAVQAGDIALLNRGAREYRPIFDSLVQHSRVVGKDVYEANDVVDFLVGSDQLKSILKGVGVVPGASYGQLRGLNRGQYAFKQVTGAARDALRGIADVRIENIRLPKIVKDINLEDIANVSDETISKLMSYGLSEKAARTVAVFASNLPARVIAGDASENLDTFVRNAFDEADHAAMAPAINEAKDFLLNTLNNSTMAYQVGRIIGNMPFVGPLTSPFANFVEGISTRIPGGAIHLTGLDAPDDIRNFIELFRYVGMPSYVRNTWTNAILHADTAGARLNGITALIDSAATAVGMRLTKSGTDLLDEFLEKTRQIYSLGKTGRYSTGFESELTQPIGVRPIADMADMVAVPDLKVLRKAVRQGMVMRALLGVSENTTILALQNKYWKPAVLLKAGFILRNAGEEMLAMLTRYGIGSWSQELLGRGIAQRENYFKAQAESALDNQQHYLSAYDAHVIRNRYDLPAALRPVHRAIERIPDGQPWQRVLHDYAKYVTDVASRANMRRHELLLHGFGGQLATKMRKLEEVATEETARGRLNTIVSKLAFGNKYSLRRMIIGGLNMELLNDMRQFEGVYLKQIMDTVGTTNLAPWERLYDRGQALQRVLIDENSNERIELVNVNGERALSTRSNNVPNQQPFSDAVLGRTQELLDDPIIDEALKPAHLIYDADIEKALPQDRLIAALRPFAEHIQSGQRWDEDFLQLFLTLNHGTPRPDIYRTLLAKMRFSEETLNELAVTNPGLYTWASRRNELVDFLRINYPGENVPSWSDVSELMNNLYRDFRDMEFVRRLPEGVDPTVAMDVKGEFLFPRIVKAGSEEKLAENVIDIGGGQINALNYRIGYSRLQEQFRAFDEIAKHLEGTTPTGRDWFNNLLLGWHRRPDLLHAPSVLRMVPGMARTRPSFYAYRGMEFDDLIDITDEGDLIFRATPRDWTEWNPSVSFSLSDFQARKYVTHQVGGMREGANRMPVLFTINGDQLLEASGHTIDDVFYGGYDSFMADVARVDRDEVIATHIANGAKFPYAHFQEDSLGRRELAVTDLSHVGRIIPDRSIGSLQIRESSLRGVFGEQVRVGGELEPVWWQFEQYLNPQELARASRFEEISNAEDFDQLVLDRIDEALKKTLADAREYSKDIPKGIDIPVVSDTAEQDIASAIELVKRNLKNEGQLVYDGEKIIQNEIGSSLEALNLFAQEQMIQTNYFLDKAQEMFPELEITSESLDLALGLNSLMSNIRTLGKPGMRLGSEVDAVVRVPKGAWKVDSFVPDQQTIDELKQLGEWHDIPFSPKLEKLAAHSTDQGYWPFYGSFDEARPAITWNGHVAASDPRFDLDLKKNIDWHGMPETTKAWVVDTRPLGLGTGPTNPNLTDMANPYFVNRTGLDKIVDSKLGLQPGQTSEWTSASSVGNPAIKFSRDDILGMVRDAITEQAPIIATSKESANFFADIIETYLRQNAPERAGRPLIGLTTFPSDPETPIKGFQKFEFDAPDPRMPPRSTHTIDHQEELKRWGDKSYIGNNVKFGFYGWDRSQEGVANFQDFPIIWNWIDEVATPAGPPSIIKRMVDHIEQRVRAGRRAKLFYRDDVNVDPIWKNVNGEAVQLEPGEIIQAHDELFNSDKMLPKDRVPPGDQRYFSTGELTYEGSTDVMWPVLAPVMYDHNEAMLGRTIWDLKAPVEVPNLAGRRERIYTERQRIRYASRDHVDKTPAGDLPDWEIVQLYRPISMNLWERGVQYGFNNVIGPTIDALTRKPMAAHAFHIAAERNRNLTKWLIAGSVEESALRQLVAKTNQWKGGHQASELTVNMWGDFGRYVGTLHNVPGADKWDQLQSISFLRGFTKEEFDDIFKHFDNILADPKSRAFVKTNFGGVSPIKLDGQIQHLKSNLDLLYSLQFDQTPNGFLRELDFRFGEGTAKKGGMTITADEFNRLPEDIRDFYSQLKPEDWAIIKRSANQREAVAKDVYEYAAEHTIRDIMPYVDSHEIRSQFADSMSGMLPFWYAEENFLKRWAKIFSEDGPTVSLERVRKLQLTYQGLKSVGVVRTDPQGRDYFVYPGSELLFDAIDAVFPGQRIPITGLLQTPTAQMIPGFSRDFGRPSLTPFAAMSMDVITAFMPEARTFEEAVIGKDRVFGNVVDAIVPKHIANIWRAVTDYFNTDINPKNQRIASAMMAAIAHAEAHGQGLPDNATPGQRDEYLRRIRDHARIIILSQAIGGLFTAGPSQVLQIPEGGSLDWITNGQVTNPAELFSAQYYELISNMGIEEGTQRFLELNQNANIRSVLNPLAYTVSRTTSPSGAPLPQTDEAYQFYTDNKGILDQYPDAGPWLLPQTKGEQDVRSQYAYDSELVTGMRERRSPEEFLTMMKYKEGANFYFTQQKVYETAYNNLKASGRAEQAATLNREWLNWSQTFKATHPLFAEMLTSDDTRQRRRRVMDQMRYLINDPLTPKADHFEGLKALQNSFDAYQAARGEISLDRTARGVVRLSQLKDVFNSWVTGFLKENPALVSYWQTILEPEAGLE